MEEKKYKFTVYKFPAANEIIEKTESKLTQAERDYHLGNLINTWENTCGWAQKEFLTQLIKQVYRFEQTPQQLSELFKMLSNFSG